MRVCPKHLTDMLTIRRDVKDKIHLPRRTSRISRSCRKTSRNIRKVKKKSKNSLSRKRKIFVPGGYGPMQYAFYSILNTDVRMDQGTAAALIARGLIMLHAELETDRAKVEYIDKWTKYGEKIIILKGHNHKHLKYLKEEVTFSALGTHTLHERWGRGRIILVLSVFGQCQDLEDIFQGLQYLR